MRVLTHNMLMCNVKGCVSSFPLIIRATQVESVPTTFNREFVVNVLPKLDWPALVKGAQFLSMSIPETLPANAKEDDEFLQQLWTVLQDIHVVEGEMECPNCHRVFPITQGIPNMLLNENEV